MRGMAVLGACYDSDHNIICRRVREKRGAALLTGVGLLATYFISGLRLRVHVHTQVVFILELRNR